MSRFNNKLFFSIIASLIMVFGLSVWHKNPDVFSLSGSQFDPGRIIDDSLFFNGGDMTTSQIQAFLNERVPVCDTNGTLPFGGTTRAAYGTANGEPPPYTCLKDYSNTYSARASDQFCAGIPAGTKTAAKVIRDVSVACDVSAKALLVLLEKEQSLVTDDWPWTIQYRSATGYGCPDTAECDSQYYGFYNQVWNAARQFNNYVENPLSFRYRAGETTNIQYHPNTACGSSPVTIVNGATAALYNYTPYQPNQAALNNLYGAGDGCSAYGNRNFWVLWNNWFGSTNSNIKLEFTDDLSIDASNNVAEVGQSYDVSFTIKNITSSQQYPANIKVSVRDSSGNNYDLPYDNNVLLDPLEEHTYQKTITFPKADDYNLKIVRKKNNAWQNPTFAEYGLNGTYDIDVRAEQSQPELTTSLDISPNAPRIGEPVTATFTITNNASHPVPMGRTKVAVRDANGNNFDFPSDPEMTLDPGESYNYSQTRTFSSVGVHQMYLVNFRSGVGWSTEFPFSANGSIVRSTGIHFRPFISHNGSIVLTPSNPRKGELVTATFTITNFGTESRYIGRTKVAVRDKNGTNFSFPSSPVLTLDPGEVYNYSETKVLTTRGVNDYWLNNYRDEVGWSTTFPVSEYSTVERSGSVVVLPAPSLTGSLSLSPSNPSVGQLVTATFTITNHADYAIPIGRTKVAVRDKNNVNFDFASDAEMTLNPGESYSYSKTRTFTSTGNHDLWLVNYRTGIGWSTTFPASENGSIIRDLQINVQP